MTSRKSCVREGSLAGPAGGNGSGCSCAALLEAMSLDRCVHTYGVHIAARVSR
jgi:hypothetical protein